MDVNSTDCGNHFTIHAVPLKLTQCFMPIISQKAENKKNKNVMKLPKEVYRDIYKLRKRERLLSMISKVETIK